MGFTKLDERILQSSIMAESPTTFKVWIALLAACRPDGIAYVSAVYLSSVCHLPMSRVDDALHKLESPDEHSRSLDEDGKRIRRVDGGYEVINYHAYRDASLKAAEAERKRLYREKSKDVRTESDDVRTLSASASASASASGTKRKGIGISFNHDTRCWDGISKEDMEDWARRYPTLDINGQLADMRDWLLDNPTRAKKRYRTFITRWMKRSVDDGGNGGDRRTRQGVDMTVGSNADPRFRGAAERNRKRFPELFAGERDEKGADDEQD